MKRILILCGLAASCATAGARETPVYEARGIITEPTFDAQEMHFRYVPAQHALLLRGYKVGVKTAGAAGALADKLKQSITSRSFCKESFGFERWSSVKERAYRREGKGGDIVIFECELLTADSDLSVTLGDFFSHAFRRRVGVAVGDKELGVNYEGEPMQVAENNSLGHHFMRKGDVIVRSALFWSTGLDAYEAVFRRPRNEHVHTFEAAFGSAKVESPPAKEDLRKLTAAPPP